MRANLQ